MHLKIFAAPDALQEKCIRSSSTIPTVKRATMPWIYVLSPLKALSTISLIHSHTHIYIHATFYPWLSTFFNIHTMIDA